MELALKVGNMINIYWARDKKSYPATITKITDTDVEVEYEDGVCKTYPVSTLCSNFLVSSR